MAEGSEYLKMRSAAAVPVRGDDIGLGMLVGLVMRKKLLFCMIIAVSMSIVIAMHLWLPIYQAHSTLVFQSASSSSLQAMSARLGTLGMQEDEGKELDRYANRLNSFDFYKMAALELRKLPPLSVFQAQMLSPKRRIIWNFKKLLHIPVQESSMKDLTDEQMAQILDSGTFYNRYSSDRLTILVKSGDKESSVVVSNLIAELGAKVIQADNLKDLDDADDYIQVQIKESEKAIHDIELSLAQIRSSRGLMNEGGQGEDASGQVVNIQRQLTDTALEFDENKRLSERLNAEYQSEKRRDPSAGNATIDPKNRYGLPKRISEIDRHNEILGLRISSLRKVLSQIIHGQSQGDEQRIYDLRKRMEFEYSLFQDLKKQAFQIEMKRIGAKSKVKVFELARESDAQRSDNLPVKLAIALIMSIFGGLPLAVVWELIKPRVRTGKDLADAGLVFMGAVPTIAGRFINDRPGNYAKLCRFDSDSEAAMAFIQIRSRILYFAEQRDVSMQVIATLSAQPGEGKSFFSRNMAACFGHMGKKTLLIDCDLRKSNSTFYFKKNDSLGLGEILTGARKFGQVVHEKILPGLDFISAGQIQTNITDLFASDALGSLLTDLREVYDHIILDTPSVIALPDGALISRVSDVPVLLASFSSTTRSDLEVSVDRIRALYSKDIFAVINQMSGTQVPLYVIHNGGKNRSGDQRPTDISRARG